LQHCPDWLSITHRAISPSVRPTPAKPSGDYTPLDGFVLSSRKEQTVLKELKKRDWVFVALCLAAAISSGIYSVKLAIDYRARDDIPQVNRKPN
jgi:hypothetical protein